MQRFGAPKIPVQGGVVSASEGRVEGSGGQLSQPSQPSGARILIAEDESLIRDLLHRRLSGLGYSCAVCCGGDDALRMLRESSYELLLAGILMPGIEGVRLLEEALAVCPDLAVILVAGSADIGAAVDSMKHGAYDYIAKPFQLNDISMSVSRALERRRLRMENQLHQRRLEEQVARRTSQLNEALETLRSTYDSTLRALGTAFDSREVDSAGHSLRIMMYASRIARHMGLDESMIRSVEQAALLHDIGKIGVPDHLLRKPGKLTEDEWLLVRKHPEIGYRILLGIHFLSTAATIVLHHQERFDGRGYPAGLRGEEIVLGARILAVADTLECITSERLFQYAQSFEAAQEEIMRVAASQLDPWVVNAFLQIPLSEFKAVREEVARRQDVGVPIPRDRSIG
jgi:putative two-component system response regulator